MPKDTTNKNALPARTAPRAARLPKYALHKPSGLARVRIEGRDVYLGPHGSTESHEAYDRVIAEWLAGGRVGGRFPGEIDPDRTTVRELAERYERHRASGRVGAEVVDKVDRPALRRLTSLYGSTRARDFTPAAARALLRRAVVEEGLSRQYVNGKLLPVIKRAFRWGVREGLVPTDVLPRLSACEPVAYGEYGARETEPVRAVEPEVLERTLAELSPTVADMANLQLLTGMRPGELCSMRWMDVDTSPPCWVYRPARHKNSHRGKQRVIPVGPKGQAILMRYRSRSEDPAIFSPREADARRRDELRARRETPLTPSQLERDRSRAVTRYDGSRTPGEHYTPASYARAIRRACERLQIAVWTPNQLRHTRATELRREYGLDAAGAVLGHSRLETTQIYAERSQALASRIAAECG